MITDPVERVIADALTRAGVAFTHESQNKHLGRARLDFYLPEHGVYIECARFHTARKIEQLSYVDDCILIQGMAAAKAFAALIAP